MGDGAAPGRTPSPMMGVLKGVRPQYVAGKICTYPVLSGILRSFQAIFCFLHSQTAIASIITLAFMFLRNKKSPVPFATPSLFYDIPAIIAHNVIVSMLYNLHWFIAI